MMPELTPTAPPYRIFTVERYPGDGRVGQRGPPADRLGPARSPRAVVLSSDRAAWGTSVQVWILAAILAAALLGVLFYVLLQPNDDEDISPPR